MPKASLLPPTDSLLNASSPEIAREIIRSAKTQAVIAGMTALAAGKSSGKRDTRQMVGLAAPQIGVQQRIIAIDTSADGSQKPQTLQFIINPRIVRSSDKTVAGREGCWSCGNICGIVERAESVTIAGYDADGKSIRLNLTGFVARIAQHEIDHLDGIRFPDQIPDDLPDRLHKVKPEEFQRYRTEWMDWRHLCSRDEWLRLKAGNDL